MLRKYRFADPAFVAVVFLDFLSMVLIAENKYLWGAFLVIASIVAILTRKYEPVNLDSMMLCLDISVAFTACGFIYSEINKISFKWLLPACIASLVALCTILFMRSSADKLRGKLFALFAFALIVLFSLLLVYLIAFPTGNALVEIIEFFWMLLGYAGKGIYTFISWLISLLPEDNSKLDINLEPSSVLDEANPEAVQNQYGKYIVIVLVVAVAIFLIVTAFNLRKIKVAKYVKGRKTIVTSRRRTNLKDALKKLFSDFLHKVAMFKYMMKNNELAKYYRLVFRNSFSINRKHKFETPKEYILRIGAEIDIDMVNSLLYKGNE